jgi:hypothetical protein
MPPILLLLLAAQEVSLPVPHPLFEGDTVHEMRLYFDSPDWYQQLRTNFEGKTNPDYAEVRFVWGDIEMDRAGVRFKGNSSYRTYPTNKKSFKIKTNEFVKGRRIQNVDTIHLNNAFKDPSMVREKIYYEIARAAGLKAPRVSYAALYVNDEYWGLYFVTEDVDGEFLENHIGDGEKGNLYKGDPSGTLQWRGRDAAPYKQSFEKENNEAADDWTDLIALVDVLNNIPPEHLRERIEAVLDVESALTLLALDAATVNLDSYIGSGHNYYLYHRKSDDRFALMPWDPNEAFGVFDMGIPLADLPSLPLFFSPRPMLMPGGQPLPPNAQLPRPLAQKLWQVEEYRERYLARIRDLIEGPASPDALRERMETLRAMIEPWVEQERRSMFTVDEFRRALEENIQTGSAGPPPPGTPPTPRFLIPGLMPFVRARAANILEQLP